MKKIIEELKKISKKKGDFPYLIKDKLDKKEISKAQEIASVWNNHLKEIQIKREIPSLEIQKKINLTIKILNL